MKLPLSWPFKYPINKNITILSLDPGFTNLGIAISLYDPESQELTLFYAKNIKTSGDSQTKLFFIYNVISIFSEKVDFLVVEDSSYFRFRSSLCVNKVIGIVELISIQLNKSLFYVNPRQIFLLKSVKKIEDNHCNDAILVAYIFVNKYFIFMKLEQRIKLISYINKIVI